MNNQTNELINPYNPDSNEEQENESALRDLFPDGPEGLEQMEDYLEDLDN